MNTVDIYFFRFLKQNKCFNQDEIQEYENVIEPIILLTNQDKCPHCNIQMEIYEHDEYLWCCPRCGCLIKRNFDPPSEYVSEVKKTFVSNIKHFLIWIEHILAREKLGGFTESLNTIRDYIHKNNIQQLSPENLRVILKKLNLSKCYKHTS